MTQLSILANHFKLQITQDVCNFHYMVIENTNPACNIYSFIIFQLSILFSFKLKHVVGLECDTHLNFTNSYLSQFFFCVLNLSN